MINNYLKIALRNLKKRMQYTIINTLGLAIALAGALLIFLFVVDECSYDTFFADAEHIYKLVEQESTPERAEWHAAVPYSFARMLVQDFPEVVGATAVAGPYNSQLVNVKNGNNEEKSFLQHGVLLADSAFFSIFNFEMLRGDPRTALVKPNSVVLTESTARRYFGDEDPLGKYITNGSNQRASVITGVCADPPKHSHFAFQSVVSSNSVAWFSQDSFNLSRAFCYLKLRKEITPEIVEAKFPQLVNRYLAGEMEKIHRVSWDEYRAAGYGHNYFLKPLTTLHLDPADFGGMKAGGNRAIIRILIAIGILILLIAGINFVNITVAQSAERTREIGMRKVMGAFRSQLTYQFLTESLLLSMFAIVGAVLIVQLALPFFNLLTDKALYIQPTSPVLWGILLSAISIGLIAGAYPALHLSALGISKLFNRFAADPLKGKWLRNGLVSFQFWISIGLIICTLVIYRQIRYLSNKDLGYDREQLLVIEGAFHRDAGFIRPFMDEVKQMPQVKQAAGSLWVQGFQDTWNDRYRLPDAAQLYEMDRIIIGDDFAETSGFELLAGALFSRESRDSSQVLLNESAVKALNLQDPVGQKLLKLENGNTEAPEEAFTIKGVVRDFNYRSLHQSIKPLIIQNNENNFGRIKYILVKLRGDHLSETISQLESTWKAMVPGRPFSYRFLDDTLNAKYEAERRTQIIFIFFSGLSIFLTCMGLFALTSYSIAWRQREIAIRRVVGAQWSDILTLFSKDYIRMILLAFVLAVPAAGWAMHTWLQGFAYGIEMTAWYFGLSGLIPLLMIWMIIGFGTLRVVRRNPTRSL